MRWTWTYELIYSLKIIKIWWTRPQDICFLFRFNRQAKQKIPVSIQFHRDSKINYTMHSCTVKYISHWVAKQVWKTGQINQSVTSDCNAMVRQSSTRNTTINRHSRNFSSRNHSTMWSFKRRATCTFAHESPLAMLHVLTVLLRHATHQKTYQRLVASCI